MKLSKGLKKILTVCGALLMVSSVASYNASAFASHHIRKNRIERRGHIRHSKRNKKTRHMSMFKRGEHDMRVASEEEENEKQHTEFGLALPAFWHPKMFLYSKNYDKGIIAMNKKLSHQSHDCMTKSEYRSAKSFAKAYLKLPKNEEAGFKAGMRYNVIADNDDLTIKSQNKNVNFAKGYILSTVFSNVFYHANKSIKSNFSDLINAFGTYRNDNGKVPFNKVSTRRNAFVYNKVLNAVKYQHTNALDYNQSQNYFAKVMKNNHLSNGQFNAIYNYATKNDGMSSDIPIAGDYDSNKIDGYWGENLIKNSPYHHVVIYNKKGMIAPEALGIITANQNTPAIRRTSNDFSKYATSFYNKNHKQVAKNFNRNYQINAQNPAYPRYLRSHNIDDTNNKYSIIYHIQRNSQPSSKITYHTPDAWIGDNNF